MKVKITLEKSCQPGRTTTCFLCAQQFQETPVLAVLTAEGTSWFTVVCARCLPDGEDRSSIRDSSLQYRENLLWLSRICEQLAFNPSTQMVTREQLRLANAPDEIVPKEGGDREEPAHQTIQ